MHERHQPKVRPTGFTFRLFGARTLHAVNSVVTKLKFTKFYQTLGDLSVDVIT